MNRRTTASTLAALTLAAGLTAVATPAQAAGCVTATEYYAIQNGWSISKVISYTGADPASHTSYVASDGYRRDTWTFPTCAAASEQFGPRATVYTKDTSTKIFVVYSKAP